jgi:hypothetical protein
MTQYITIKDAADLSGKSIQTIRRMIKSKKVKYRKDRTPQGFNYLIDLNSLQDTCKISASTLQNFVQSEPEVQASTTTTETVQSEAKKVDTVDLDLRNRPASTVDAEEEPMHSAMQTALMESQPERAHQQIVSYEPVKEFTDTMQKLIEQHGKEKENLFRLIETFQNKVISLENKIKVESNAKKGWFNLW